MLSVFDVAKYILQMDTNGMTTMKLQKLCYYCQAYSLGWTNEKLFYEDIYAWKNGPVCRTLFNAHKGIFLIYLSDLKSSPGSASNVKWNAKIIVDQVFNALKGFTADQLRSLSHSEDPWIQAREQGENVVISEDSMKKFYSER